MLQISIQPIIRLWTVCRTAVCREFVVFLFIVLEGWLNLSQEGEYARVFESRTAHLLSLMRCI